MVPIDLSLAVPASLTCARAFADDPLTAYLVADESRRPNLHYAFEAVLRMSALGGAEAYATSRACEGVAVWMPPERKQTLSIALRAGYPFLPLRCGWRYLFRDMRTISFCEKIEKRYAPPRHCYLGLLAVDPLHQRKGYASRLIRPMLRRLDEEKMACYLDTQNIKNVAMYEHFGFALVHQATMPGADLPLYAMLREV